MKDFKKKESQLPVLLSDTVFLRHFRQVISHLYWICTNNVPQIGVLSLNLWGDKIRNQYKKY